jgi:hypothetical protein
MTRAVTHTEQNEQNERGSSLAAMAARTPTALWLVDAALVAALDARLGPPIDSYLNGSQTWLTPDGPGGIELEWRLHPIAGYQTPGGLSHYDVWEAVVGALAHSGEPEALALGTARLSLSSLWDGLECFAAYGDEIEPATLAAAAGEVLGRAPDASGMADHDAIGDAWERTGGAVSIVGLLLEQLRPGPA